MVSEADAGLTGAVSGGLPILMTLVAFMTISLYNIIELTVIIFTTFKRRSGLYFWSFIFATWGIAPHTIGFILKFFAITSSNYLPCTLVAFGWVAMVTGQSVVLYSRLHLVVCNETRLRYVLYMIIFDAVVFHTPVIILAFGANSPNPTRFVGVFSIFDKVQIAIFFVQESIISVLYIYETIRLLGPVGKDRQSPLQKLLAHLILVNVLVLVFDIALLGVQYSGYYAIQTTLKAAIYSVKLKIEFSVLNRLVALTQNKDSWGNRIHSTSYPFTIADGSATTQAHTLGSSNQGGSFIMEEVPPLPKGSLQPRVRTAQLG